MSLKEIVNLLEEEGFGNSKVTTYSALLSKTFNNPFFSNISLREIIAEMNINIHDPYYDYNYGGRARKNEFDLERDIPELIMKIKGEYYWGLQMRQRIDKPVEPKIKNLINFIPVAMNLVNFSYITGIRFTATIPLLDTFEEENLLTKLFLDVNNPENSYIILKKEYNEIEDVKYNLFDLTKFCKDHVPGWHIEEY